MPGALLDTHALYWLVTSPDALSEEALVAISDNQADGTLWVSPITAWELAIGSRKPPHKNPPNLGMRTPSDWFSVATRSVGARIVPIGHRIACEAAAVVTMTGHKDTGDCYLIATARFTGLSERHRLLNSPLRANPISADREFCSQVASSPAVALVLPCCAYRYI